MSVRRVILDPGHGEYSGPQSDESLRRRLAGHLAARLREYQGEGVQDVTLEGSGTVSARFDGLTGAQAVQALAHRQVFCREAGDRVVFAVGADTRFEDLDYVQGAVAELLE